MKLDCNIFKSIANAFFGVHEGPFLGYLRYHLGVRVPRSTPPSLIVRLRRPLALFAA